MKKRKKSLSILFILIFTLTQCVNIANFNFLRSERVYADEVPTVNANLSNLEISNGMLEPGFNSDIKNYTVNVGYDTMSITFTPTAQDVAATITVDGSNVSSGQLSQAINLNVGNNPVTIVVSAGGNQNIYNINVIRSSNPYLQGIAGAINMNLNPKPFGSTTYSFTSKLGSTVTTTTITPTATDPNAIITISNNGANTQTVVSGTVSAPISIVSGLNNIVIIVKSKTGMDQRIYTFNVARYTLSISADAEMTESNLNERYIDVTTPYTFTDSTLDSSNFTLVNPPIGLTVESVEYISDTHCHVNLAYDGTDFDSNITNLGLTIAAAELTNNTSLTSSNSLTITAINNEVESISIADDGEITECQENGEVITVTLNGGTFASNVNPDNWTITGLPTGVSKGSVARVSANKVQITLAGNSTVDYDCDITNIQVSCTASEYRDSTGGDVLSANSGIILRANNVPTVVTDATVNAVTNYSATVSGNVTSDGRLPIVERGIQYKKSADSDYITVPEGGNTPGNFNVNLTGLQTNTEYNARAYAVNSEGTSYGDVVTFSTQDDANVRLSNLELSAGTMQPVFSSDIKNYTVNVGYNTTSIALTPTAQDAAATITVNGQAISSGQPSQAISLNVGDNPVTITISAGGNQNIYNINVIRSSNPYLQSIGAPFVMSMTPKPFSSTVYSYTARITLASITIKPTAVDSEAIITISNNGTASQTVVSGTVSMPIALVLGLNNIVITVKSKTGTDQKTYTFAVTK